MLEEETKANEGIESHSAEDDELHNLMQNMSIGKLNF